MPSRAATHIAISLGKSVAQITAQFAPIPALVPVAEALCAIVQLCQNVGHNRNAARQLGDRCHTLVLALGEYQEKTITNNITQARNAVLARLIDIQGRMSGWAKLRKVDSFLKQDEIAKDIASCHTQITDCVNTFELTSHFEIHEWMSDFEANQKLDHAQLLESLSQIQESQAIVEARTVDTHNIARQMMEMFQKAMGENQQSREKIHEGLSANLYQFQTEFQELLPDFHLRFGEVKKIGDFPVRGTATMDIYEGIYLGKEKVAIKAIRSMKFDEQTKRRFTREAKIWGKVWKRDHGFHIVPFYGFCQMEGPFPCMISPWQKNGDAIAYVKANDKALDYLKFIVHLAQGVEVLHSMELVHGDIRAINVLVNDHGLPLLSDFGLSKIIQDTATVPLTQSSMMADSCRYFAPEAFVENGVLSTATDIYALAMTILELITHQQPYRNVKHHFDAGHRALRGIRPDRPTESEIVRRGLDDKLWEILVSSWSVDPMKRPSIESFIRALQSCISSPYFRST